MRQPYWWVVSSYQGGPVILGPFDTAEEADRCGFEKLHGEFEDVVMLYTRDKVRATSIIKAKILEKTASLEQALRRASHQPPQAKEA